MDFVITLKEWNKVTNSFLYISFKIDMEFLSLETANNFSGRTMAPLRVAALTQQEEDGDSLPEVYILFLDDFTPFKSI